MKPIIVVTSTRTTQHKDVTIKHYPFIDIVPIAVDKSCIQSRYDWLIFTSVNAIKIFKPYMNDIHFDKIAVIGKKTLKMAQKYNLNVSLIPDEHTQEGLVNAFGDHFTDQSILIPCSLQARPILVNELSNLNNTVQRLHIYQPVQNEFNISIVHKMIQNNEITHITFSSPSAVSNYFDKYDKIENVKVYAIGEITKAKLNQYNQDCVVSNVSTLDEMINLITSEV